MFGRKLSKKNRAVIMAVKLSLLVAVASLLSTRQAFAAPPDNMPVWRVQVNFGTSTTSDAGTDDNVKVELRSNNATWIDSFSDDFEPGSRTYDLRLENITTLSDIDFLRVSKTGDDGWSIARMRLIVNGVAIFDQQFQPGLVLDNEGGHSTVFFMDDFFMRNRSEWITYAVPRRPDIIPLNDMRLRIESAFGDFASSDPEDVGDLILAEYQFVQIYTLNGNTWHVHVSLENDKPLWNPDVDVDFDLTVTLVASTLLNVKPDFRVTNLVVDAPWPADGGDRAWNFTNNTLKLRLNEMLKNFSYRSGTGLVIAANGDLYFNPLVIFNPSISVGVNSNQAKPVTEIPNRSRSLLGLQVKTGGEIKAYADTAFNVTVRSGLAEDAPVNVTFTLPAEVSLANWTIEGKDGEVTRQLVPQVAPQMDGTTLITVRDHVAAGTETSYVLHLLFQQAENKVAQIVTRVLPTTAIGTGITPPEATTSFRFDAGGITAEGTLVHSSESKRVLGP